MGFPPGPAPPVASFEAGQRRRGTLIASRAPRGQRGQNKARPHGTRSAAALAKVFWHSNHLSKRNRVSRPRSLSQNRFSRGRQRSISGTGSSRLSGPVSANGKVLFFGFDAVSQDFAPYLWPSGRCSLRRNDHYNRLATISGGETGRSCNSSHQQRNSALKKPGACSARCLRPG